MALRLFVSLIAGIVLLAAVAPAQAQGGPPVAAGAITPAVRAPTQLSQTGGPSPLAVALGAGLALSGAAVLLSKPR